MASFAVKSVLAVATSRSTQYDTIKTVSKQFSIARVSAIFQAKNI
ncbi:MAG: hypothetical protein ORO03_10295 [Alphaproteobacteria bacterium]|nr:hypothetical protein [Alphaproteobacteria bacterium]